MCHSTRLQGNLNQGVGIDRVFGENVPNLVDIKRERSQGWDEEVVATQHMTSNNLCVFWEDTRFITRDVEHHAIPELTNVTPIPNATVNSGPDAETFTQELTDYTEEVSSQRIPPMVHIEGNNHENCSVRVIPDGEISNNSQNLLNCETEGEQVSEQGPLSRKYTEPSVPGSHHSKFANITGVFGWGFLQQKFSSAQY